MSSEISVCQVSGYYGYGGISKFVEDLSSKLAAKFDVTFVCRRVIREPKNGLNLIELKPRNTFDYWSKLRKLSRNFDIMHCHDVYALPGLVKNKGKGKIIYTIPGIVPLKYTKLRDIPGTIFAHLCANYATPKVDMAVGISDYMVAELKERYKCQNIVKIYYGLDIKKFHSVDNNTQSKLKMGYPMLFWAAVLEWHKGISFLIESMPHILEEFPEASLVLAGSGRDEKIFKERVRKIGLEKKVIFLGYLQNLVPYFNAADIVVVPSYWESFCLPIVEGMACGKPVIARDAYSNREHIINSRAGILFKRDDPEELVCAIREIMDNYEKYSSNARKYAEKFDLSIIAAEYVNVYTELLEE